jgi:hypothetical protein
VPRFRLPGLRIPREGPQRTALNATLAASALLLLGVLGAHGCSERWAIETEMQRYLKLGPRGGAAALERDLLRDHPVGEGIGPLFARLSRLGFDCGGAVDPAGRGECRFRAPTPDRRLSTTTVALRHDGQRIEALSVRMAVSTP